MNLRTGCDDTAVIRPVNPFGRPQKLHLRKSRQVRAAVIAGDIKPIDIVRPRMIALKFLPQKPPAPALVFLRIHHHPVGSIIRPQQRPVPRIAFRRIIGRCDGIPSDNVLNAVWKLKLNPTRCGSPGQPFGGRGVIKGLLFRFGFINLRTGRDGSAVVGQIHPLGKPRPAEHTNKTSNQKKPEPFNACHVSPSF